MSDRQVGRVNQQSKGDTPLVSGTLQRTAVRSVADQEVEAGTSRESRFQHDFSQVPIRGGLPIQAKLTIGAVGDKYEQEADRVAQEVVSRINTPASAQSTQGQSVQREDEADEELQAKPSISNLQRSPLSAEVQREAMPQEEELQAKSTLQSGEGKVGGDASTDLESAINSARGSGQPLEASLQRSMGAAMGMDFREVKVHTDAQSDQLNRSIQAKAFTTRQDVFFRQGAYDPGSRNGQELIAHELAHISQQSRSAVQKTSENVSSSIIARKFVESKSNPDEYVWKQQDGGTSGKYRWLIYSIEEKKGIYLDLDKVGETDLSALDQSTFKILLNKKAIVKSGRSSPVVIKSLSEPEKEQVLNSLKSGLTLRKQTGGNIGKMDFRFSDAHGVLYYNQSLGPPVKENKEDGNPRYPDVKFVPVTSSELQNIRQEQESSHYHERVAYENYVYVRKNLSETMPTRDEKAVFKWGANKLEKSHNPEDVTLEIKKYILDTVSNLPPPQDSYQQVTSPLKGKDREDGQDAAMKNINASAYALATGDTNAKSTKWEWLHIRGARLGGATEPHNLVSGTVAANSHMIPIEHDVLELSKLASTDQPLVVRWRVGDGNYSHQRRWISIEIETPQGLNNTIGEQILPLRGFARWVFNPHTGAIIDRLDRDLLWGVGQIKIRDEHYKEPVIGLSPMLTDESRAYPMMPYQRPDLRTEHHQQGNLFEVGEVNRPLDLAQLQQVPVVAEWSAKQVLQFVQKFETPTAVINAINQELLFNNLILEAQLGNMPSVFFIPGGQLRMVHQPQAGDAGRMLTYLLEPDNSRKIWIANRQEMRLRFRKPDFSNNQANKQEKLKDQIALRKFLNVSSHRGLTQLNKDNELNTD